MRRVLLVPLLWGLASICAAQSLPELLRACADRFDAQQRAQTAAPAEASHESSTKIDAEEHTNALLMSLTTDCPKAIGAFSGSDLDGLAVEERRMVTPDWRDLAAILERARADQTPAAVSAVSDASLAAILAELAPAPLTGLEGRTLRRERLRAWVLRQLRKLFGPDTALGQWFDGLTEDDLRAFSDVVLTVVSVLFMLLLAALGLALYRVCSRSWGTRRHQHQVELPEGLAEVPLLSAERIRTLPVAQQPLALMRLVLARIDEGGLCTIRAAMTNSEIAIALAEAAGIRVYDLSQLADRCLFGGHDATQAELAPCWAEVDALGLRPL